jgi:hypothetical protein
MKCLIRKRRTIFIIAPDAAKAVIRNRDSWSRGANPHEWLKPGTWGWIIKWRTDKKRRGRLRKLRRAQVSLFCIPKGAAAT